MEPQDSLTHPQVPVTCPCPQPHRSSPYHLIPLPENPSEYYPPIYTWVFQVVCFPQVSPPKSTTPLPSTCWGRTKGSFRALGLCEPFVTWYLFSCKELLAPPSWSTTHCRLSATAYSLYSQLPSILEAIPPSAIFGRAMPWWQGLTYRRPSFLCRGKEIPVTQSLTAHPTVWLSICVVRKCHGYSVMTGTNLVSETLAFCSEPIQLV